MLAIRLASQRAVRCACAFRIARTSNRQISIVHPKGFAAQANAVNRFTVRAYATKEILSDDKIYHKLADETLDQLTEWFEEIAERSDDTDVDVSFGNGVLTVNLGKDFGTYVINKQSPNRQIWLSSPLCGPRRYDFRLDTKKWVYAHDNMTIDQLLKKEIAQYLGEDVELDIDPHND